ncbi:amino acid transporter AVT3B-like [Dendronephthya gigantea]|uniref:amino acid transporter AVT3B-like n=1 Tax=Dendronephthya gigantea TaxID=151771 RepID=UPI00106B38F5|nr:amino acid transporter AVT3B-like [Dendronephthya gigantea]
MTVPAVDQRQKTSKERSPIWNKLSDFANVFKAFIGANYLAVPFAFKQSGLILGIIGLVVIAYITDHCCVLIVKCKKAAIDQMMNSTYQYSYDDGSDEYRKLEERKKRKRSNLEFTISYGDLGRIAMGRWGSLIVNAALIVTQFSFCVNYFIFIGDTLTRVWPLANKNHTSKPTLNATSLLGASPSEKHPSAPSAIYLMMIPFPFFLLQTYVRNMRNLGPLSSVANACVFLGFFSILGFILNGINFSNIYSDNFNLFKFSTFPIFFGQIVGAYEGIGTIIPIEASMKENRPNFRKYLHCAISLVSIILGTFGIFGYIHFSDEVEQIISDNLPYGTLSIVVQITLCIGILFTFPLQIFPVVQIAENFFFKEKSERTTITASYSSEHSGLRPDTPVVVQYGSISPSEEEISGEENDNGSVNPVLVRNSRGLCSCDMGWSTWKRNFVRTILVCIAFGVAYVSRNYYAYVSALSGSIGSSLLAFILPCAFHLIIKRDTLPTLIVAKDIILILFGIIAGIVGFVTTLIKIIK